MQLPKLDIRDRKTGQPIKESECSLAIIIEIKVSAPGYEAVELYARGQADRLPVFLNKETG